MQGAGIDTTAWRQWRTIVGHAGRTGWHAAETGHVGLMMSVHLVREAIVTGHSWMRVLQTLRTTVGYARDLVHQRFQVAQTLGRDVLAGVPLDAVLLVRMVRRHGRMGRRMRMRWRWVRVMRMILALAKRSGRRLMRMRIVRLWRLLVITHVTGVAIMRWRAGTAVMASRVGPAGRIVLAMVVTQILLRHAGGWFKVGMLDARRRERRWFQVVLRRDRGIDFRRQVGMRERQRHGLGTLAVVLQVHRALLGAHVVRTVVVHALAVEAGVVHRLRIWCHMRERFRR